jgi:NAD(P) transhydrogenase subunit beta
LTVYAADPRVFTPVGGLLGISLVRPIGGADMPVVISLLNSYAGLAAAATGFALSNTILIVCGALDGASGFFLSLVMSKAMNRSFTNILFGGFGEKRRRHSGRAGSPLSQASIGDAFDRLTSARSVIVVPGYGMAARAASMPYASWLNLNARPHGQIRHPPVAAGCRPMNVLAEAMCLMTGSLTSTRSTMNCQHRCRIGSGR